MGIEGTPEFGGAEEPKDHTDETFRVTPDTSDLNPAAADRFVAQADIGMSVTPMDNGLYRINFRIDGQAAGTAINEAAHIVVDREGNAVMPGDPPPESPSPFTFREPFGDAYTELSRKEQQAAGRLLDKLHSVVFGLYPNNAVRSPLVPGLTSNTLRKKDFVISATTCDPRSPEAKRLGSAYLYIAERKPPDQPAHIVQYHLGQDGIARRRDGVKPTTADNLREKFAFRQRINRAAKRGPEEKRRAEREVETELRERDNMLAAARRGENYLPVGTAEIVAAGRFIGERLRILDKLAFLGEI